MKPMTLNGKQLEELERLVNQEMQESRSELHHTATRDYKTIVKSRTALLESILEHIRRSREADA